MTITIQEAEKLRAENIRLREVLARIADASDYFSAESRAEDLGTDTLAYAHKSTCILARAALQGDTPPSPDVPAFDAWYQTRFASIPKQTREYQMAKAAFAAGQASVKGGE
jgi:hypothetical protein